jgi:CDP-diglyceride synthetase
MPIGRERKRDVTVTMLAIAAVHPHHHSTPLLVAFHKDLFNSVALFFVAMTAWGLYLSLRGQGPTGSFLGALILGEGLVLVQAVSGLLLVATGHHPESVLHWLYGAIIILTLPTLFLVTSSRQQTPRTLSLYYGLGCFFLVVVALVRAQGTG